MVLAQIFGLKPKLISELEPGNRFVWVLNGQQLDVCVRTVTRLTIAITVVVITTEKPVKFDDEIHFRVISGKIVWQEYDYLRYHNLLERLGEALRQLQR